MQVPDLQGELGTEDFALWCQACDASNTPGEATGPAVVVYGDEGEALELTLTPATVSEATGLLRAPVDLTGGNGFERGKNYLVRWSATVDSVARVGVGTLKVT